MEKLTRLTLIVFISILNLSNSVKEPDYIEEEYCIPATNDYGYPEIVAMDEIYFDNELSIADTKAINIIKLTEGFSSKPYICPAGKLTIGYGFINRRESRLTKAESEIILIEIYKSTKEDVEKLVKNENLNEYQIAALTSFTYNVGIGALKRSTLLKRVNTNNLEAVKYQFARWNKVKKDGEATVLGGLVKRRKMESELWLRT